MNFDVMISSQSHFMPWTVPRKVARGGWIADEDTPAALRQEQITFRRLS